VTDGDADGIGYALLGSDVGAIDLDKCRNPITGKVEGWAEAVHDGQAYSEITVSGTGTRILGTATGPRRMRRFDLGGGAGIELFRNAERYITISGNQRGTCDG
jgi:primase-polymerase (primpol)-like protein